MNTVLAIDDDKTTLGILEAQLTGMGYKVITERSAVKGMEIARSFNPDVILLDLLMPVMDGFSVLSSLRKEKNTKDIPVIMLTSQKEKDTVINAMKHGVADYIVKPYDPGRLAAKISSAIKYGGTKKQDSDSRFIEIVRHGEVAVVVMKGDMTEKGFLSDARTIFNPFFIKQVAGKVCVFDLRSLDELSAAGMKELESFIGLLGSSKIKIVTGKHYGEIVSMTDIEDKAELFLSFGDLELSMGGM